MPASIVRLSAGRLSLSDEAQALCFLAGANSIFLGDRLLTTPNPDADDDRRLLEKLGLRLQEQIRLKPDTTYDGAYDGSAREGSPYDGSS
jgi:biotin synthase